MASESTSGPQGPRQNQSRRGRGGANQGRNTEAPSGENANSERGRSRGGRRGGNRGRGGRGGPSGGRRNQTGENETDLPEPSVPPPPNQLGSGNSGARLTGDAKAQEGETVAHGNAAAEADDAEDGEVCFICASPVVHSAVSPCNHRTCHICALRLRALYKSKACAHCRVNIGFGTGIGYKC